MIESYRIRNFKSCADVALNLTGVNVLVGLNSAGKSTILQPLLLVRQAALTGSLAVERIPLNGPIVNVGTGQDVLFEFADSEETTFAWDGVEITIPYQVEANEVEIATTGAIDPAAPPVSGLTYISNARIGPQALYERYRQYERPSAITGVLGEDAPGFLSARGGSVPGGTRTQRDQGATGSILEQVNYWMSRISPTVGLDLTDFHQLDGLAVRFTFDGKEGLSTRPYRGSNVGFGLTHSLSIITALVAAPEATLLIIESPEANLHPRAQKRLGHLIGQAAGDGVQVILETHSPYLVSGLAEAVSSGWLKRKELTLNYCTRIDAETKVAHVQVNQAGRLVHMGGYDELPEEYWREFLP